MTVRFGTYVCDEKHVTYDLGDIPQCRVIKHFWLEVDPKNAFGQSVRGVNSAVSPSEFQVIVETQDRAIFPVFCLSDGGVEIVIKGVNETLPSRRASCF